uniref:Integrase catalytic domain-containing protein n=1 Tax=Tanacetum cinerariifolium TaxID=118510 RepID=A0A699HCD2_TANCI|nr:hypothetical protein [Tanacetum cinerariifolium]
MTATFKYMDVPNDAIKLMLFLYSLEGAARIWYEKEPPNSILTWDDLVNKFVNQFFPPYKTTHLKNDISHFTQRFKETFGEAWEHFKELLRASGGNLLSKTTRKALKIIENKSKVRYSRSKSNVSRLNTNSKDSATVEKTCVIYGGAHAYYDCIATDSNQPSVCAATSTYNQVSPANRASHQIPPPGFASMQNNPNRQLFKNIASTSGTLPSNNVPNPKGEMKVVTTRSGLAYEGPSIPTNSPLKKVVEQDTKEITEKEHSNCQRSIAHIQTPVVPISIPEPDVPRTQPKPTIPYPSRLNDQKLYEKASNQIENFFQIFRDLHFDISFVESLLLMPKFASIIKSLLTNKDKLFELAKVPLNENCSAMLLKKLLEKLGDLASLLELTPTRMTLELADRSITRPKGVVEDVFVKVGKFYFPTDFMVVDFEANPRVPLILGRSFLRTGRALIDVYREEITLRVNDESYNPKSINPTLVSNPSISEKESCKEPIVKSSSPTLTPFGEIQSQRRVNPKIHDVIKKEVIKLLDAGMVYSISDSPWVSPIHCVPKKGGMTVVANENNELIPTRLVTGWRVCIDYRKLNDATRKDHFPLPFMDQMVEREEIVLGHKISKSRIEVDRAKVDVIAKLYHPTTIKGVRSFLGHAVFYRRFTQDFSKIARPMTHLLEKETPFMFSKECVDAFNTLKKKLTEAPILVVPDWNLPFELMCDASDFAIGAVLGQRKTKHFQPIHYASKTTTEAQIHYTTTKKEMLAVVYAFEKFRPYLVLSKSIVYTDHLALKYLLNKQDATPRLENLHKDVLENKDINENFPLETLGSLSSNSTPWAIISDRGTHFCNDQFTRVMIKYGVTHHLTTAYHPQTSGQVKVSNHRLKRILERTVGDNRASWSDKLDDALWAFRTAFKTPIGCTSYKLTAGDHQKLQLNELNELRDQAYENSVIYKERTKKLHDSKIKNRIFNVGDQVLLFNSRLKIFSKKLKTRWSCPFTITQVFSYGTVELSQPNGPNFKVNGHRVKHYFRGDIPSKVVLDLHTFPMDK